MLLIKPKNIFSIVAVLSAFLLFFAGAIADTVSSAQVTPVLIDVRTQPEFESGHLTNAINIDLKNIEEKITILYPDKNTPLNLYCRSGNRSGMAKVVLERMGYTHVTNLGAYETLKNK